MQKAFELKASSDGQEVDLMMFGYIGADWYGDGSRIDASVVANSLNAHKSAKSINLQINSGGGDAFHAMAIYSTLKAHGAKIKAVIHGICASAMTVVASAADEIVMNEAGLYMIHEARSASEGTAAEQQINVDLTRKINEQAASVYAARTGQKLEDVVSMMAAETWMTGPEAKAKGFVSSLSPLKTMTASYGPSQFSKIPDRLKPLLATLLPQTSGDSQKGTPQMAAENTTTTVLTTPATATPQAPVVTNEKPDLAKIERDRCAQISAACSMAGKSDLAAKYIEDSNATVATVQAALLTMVCQERKPVGNSGPDGGSQEKPNPNLAFEKEFESQAEVLESIGITKEAYVSSRRRDEGIDTKSLTPTK